MHLSARLTLLIITAIGASTTPTYKPLRPPALPLAVRTPYTNAWTSTSGTDTLNTKGAQFWHFPGQPLGWEGIVTVDGISYEWLGTAQESFPETTFKKAKPLTVSYDSQYSNFTFSTGQVEINASFLSPVLPDDLHRTSLPLSYLTVAVRSIDGGSHNVSMYGDVSGNWLSSSNCSCEATPLNWKLFEGARAVDGSFRVDRAGLFTWLYGLQHPFEMAEDGSDLPSWGDFSYSSRAGDSTMTYGSGHSVKLRYKYITQHHLDSTIVDYNYALRPSHDTVLAFAHDLGIIGPAGSSEVTYTLGHIQQTVVNYLSTSGVQKLKPWWRKRYDNSFDMIRAHFDDLEEVQKLASRWESQLKRDIENYYEGRLDSSVDEDVDHRSNHQLEFLDPVSSYADSSVLGLQEKDAEKDAYYAILALSTRQVCFLQIE